MAAAPSYTDTSLVPKDYIPTTIDLNAIALELAQGWYSDDQIRVNHGMSVEQWQSLRTNEKFLTLCLNYRTEMQKEGQQFKITVKRKAEQHLATVDNMIMSPDTPASVKLSAIQWLSRMAEYEPKEAKGTGGSTQVTVLWAGDAPQQIGGMTIDVNQE